MGDNNRVNCINNIILCCKSIFEYENFLNQIYSNIKDNTNIKLEGYLIDLKEFEKFKIDIDYQLYKENIYDYKDDISVKITLLFSENKPLIELKRFKQLKIKSNQELLNIFSNKNEYILINSEIWNYICKKGKESESFITYYINNSNLYFSLEDGSFAYFQHNKNILNIDSFIKRQEDKIIESMTNKNKILDNNDNDSSNHNENSNEKKEFIFNNINNDNKLLSLINVMEEFFSFENEIIKESSDIINSGYLIDKKSIDKWKNYTFYEIIKKNYFKRFLEQKIQILEKEKEEILNYMIDLINKNNFEINNEIHIKSLHSFTEEEFETFTNKNLLVLINSNLYELMRDKREAKENPIEYKIKNKTITFKFKKKYFNFYLINSNILYNDFKFDLFILIQIFYFQEEFKNKINTQKQINFNFKCLIDKELISKYKKFYHYDILYNFLRKERNISKDNEEIIGIFENLPKDYMNSIDEEFDINNINFDRNKKFIVEELIEENKKKYKYMNNFEIIDSIHSILMLRHFKNDIKNFINFGRIYKIKNKVLIAFKDKETKLPYLEIGYINEQNTYNIEYIIDIIYDKNLIKNLEFFDQYFNEENNKIIIDSIYHNNESNTFLLENTNFYFFKLSTNKNDYINSLDLNPLINNPIENYLKLKEEGEEKEKSNDNSEIYLELIINFYKLDEYIKSNNKRYNLEEEYYLLNENWIKEFKLNFNYNQILKSDEIKTIIKDNFYNDNYINKILNILPENTKKNLNKLKESNFINNKLNNKNFYKINNNYAYKNDNNNPLIAYNFGLINKNTFEYFKKNNINITEEDLEKVKCFFLENKMFMILEKEENNSISIGHYEENLFSTEIIINTNHKENIKIIKYLFESEGYNKYLKYLFFENEISEIKGTNIKIIQVSKKIDQYNYNKQIIGEKLKAFILLSIYQHNINDQTKESRNKDYEEIFLINLNWLKLYEFEKINKIINDNINNIIIKDNIYDNLELFNDFILSLDKKEIKEIDENFNQMTFIEDNFFSKSESLQLRNDEKISYYNNFIFINKKIIDLFFEYFDIKREYSSIKLYSGNKKNIIEFDKNNHRVILLGTVLNYENIFKLEFIFDYKDKYNLDDELEQIYKDFNNYINNNLIFNDEFENDCISPIFNKYDSIIGYGYKYNDYLLKNNFLENYDIKKEHINMIQLFSYYNFINNKINQKADLKLENSDYFLVNSQWIDYIKNIYNYEEICKEINSKKELNNINDDNNDKYNFKKLRYIYEIFKKFSPNSFAKINQIKDQKVSVDEIINLHPDIIQIENSEKGSINLYNNFEIINKKIINLFRKENITEKNFSECFIKEDYIIIHFPKNMIGNNQYNTIIGKLNKNIFEIDYILTYEDEYTRNRHIYRINNDLNNFLNGYQNYDLFEPLLDDEQHNFNVVGAIMKYNPKKNSNNANYIQNNKIIEPINGNNNKETNNSSQTNNFEDYNQDNYEKKDLNNNNNINEDEYNLDYKTNSNLIKDNFPFPPLIGLQNIGATCYMNATLQCFCHIEKFVNKFKYSKTIINKVRSDKNNLTASFKLLIEKLWPNNYDPSNNTPKYFAPEEFKKKISEMNPLFKGIAANDAKDLVNFIIMTLHEELNKAKNNQVNNNNNVTLDQRDQNLMFKIFKNNFIYENQSIISDLFYAINCNVTQCGGCREKTYNYQTYFFMVFPLEEVRKFKFNNFIYNLNNNVVDIFDCFNYDRKINEMSGENSMYCNFCRRTCTSSMSTHLITGPEILILLLNRGKGIQFNIKINFPEYLDLLNYIQYNNTGHKYKLIGVITHMGESGMGGHFIAYCRHPIIDQQWHKYNDAIVTEVNDFQNEVIIFGMPYLLFYQKVK